MKDIMKKLRKITLTAVLAFMVLIFTLVLAGCGSEDGTLTYNFKQGIHEMDITFFENAPPERIYPLTNFKIITVLDNQAAYDATDGVVRIVGIDEKFFSLTETEKTFDALMGRSALNPSGEKIYLEFDGLAGQLFQNAEQYIGNFFVKAKYRSTMDFTDTICLNPNLYEVYDSGCKNEPSQSYSGQGAPLAVDNVESIIYPGGGSSVEFRVNLRTRGKGIVNTITLADARLGAEELPCEFQETQEDKRRITLKKEKQEATLLCRRFLRDSSSYETTLSLKFNYDYEIKEQHRLKLVK